MKKIIKLSLLSAAVLTQLNAQNVVSLQEIEVVSATKSKQSIKDVTSNINVITNEELEERHYTSVTEALNTISGISFTANGGLGTSTSVNVRGFDSKRVLVLIDGVRYNDITGLNGAPFEHLMINDIERIEVVKGAQSGIWGADASAGVINIITKDATKGLHGFLNGEYGSFNTKKYGAGASYKTDKYYIKTSIQRVDSDGFSAQAPKGSDVDNYEDDGYKNTTSNIKFGFNINETNKIDISHTMIDAYSEYDGFNDPDAKNSSDTQDSFTKVNFNHIDSFNEFDLYVSKSKFDREYNSGTKSEYDGEVYEYGAKSNIKYDEKDFIVVGGDYKSFEQKNSINKKYNNKSIFLSNSNLFNCPIGGEMIVTESLRYDRYSDFDNKTTGKIGVKRVINDELYLSANYGTAYNAPTLSNLYGQWGANPNLKPENTKSYDISLGYKDLKITYFNSKIEDMIDYYDPDGWAGVIPGKYTNLDGTTTIKGVEVEYAKNITEDIFFSANYTYLNAKDDNDKGLARRPKDSYKISLDYYGITNLHLGVNGEYIGQRFDTAGQSIGKYAVVNTVANYDINKELSVYAKIDNLFDRYYQVVDGYATAPRSAYVGFKARF